MALIKRTKRKSTRQHLAHQIDITLEGVAVAMEAVQASAKKRKEARESIREIEHEGDVARADVIRVMTSNLTTSLDREDLFRASRSVDDVLDNTRDFVREMTLWRANPGEESIAALTHVMASLAILREAIVEDKPFAVREKCIAARKEAGQVRRAYQEGLAELFADELTMDTLKSRELLRRLDVIGLRLAEAVDALLDGLIKRAI